MKKRKVLITIELLLCSLFLILYVFSLLVFKKFDDISFEQLLYNIINSEGADKTIVYQFSSYIIAVLICFFAFVYIKFEVYYSLKIKVLINVVIKNKIIKINPFKKTILKTICFLFFIGFVSVYKSFDYLNLSEYIESQRTASTIFEDYYVDGKSVDIKFPEEKRNLIYIYLESMESTNISKTNGGIFEKSLIPNLEKIALENINFSNNNTIGGPIQLYNTGWTMAAIVAQTSGIPLKVLDGNNYNNYSDSLPGVYNLGDILYDNGYNNYFMIGSNADFAGRRDYFTSHGNYTIYDYLYAKQTNLIPNDYSVWWGYEDLKLFEFAKNKILEASKSDKPFNFTLLTVDTHFTDGYMDSTCKNIFDNKYSNSIYCSDSKLGEFINWIKKQDFYDNTTIVIVGDHLTMQSNFYPKNDNYQRTMYNSFINVPFNFDNEKNRYFSSFDIFPTTLASLGVQIEGDKLGLGVNLFSNKKTLLEDFGKEYLNTELAKKSFYYDNVILGDTYFEMNGLK